VVPTPGVGTSDPGGSAGPGEGRLGTGRGEEGGQGTPTHQEGPAGSHRALPGGGRDRKKGRSGGNRVTDCPERVEPGRTMLGERQEQWLEAGLSSSETSWNLLGQGTVMTYIDELPGPGERFWTDNWNGYPAARQQLLETLSSTQAANPVVLSGDIHAFLAANLNQIPQQPDSPVVASEFATTSISSQATPQKSLDRRGRDNPNLLLLDGRYRGYLRLDLDRQRLRADMVAMDTVSRARSGSHVLASFVVENGVPGPRVA